MTPPQTRAANSGPGAPAGLRSRVAIPAPERRHLHPNLAHGGTHPPPRSGPDYATSGSAAGSTAIAVPGDAPLIITEAEFAASCSDLVERWA